jgi:hypothetical protein
MAEAAETACVAGAARAKLFVLLISSLAIEVAAEAIAVLEAPPTTPDKKPAA